MDRQTVPLVWMTIDDLHGALTQLAPYPNRWNGTANVERDPGPDLTFEAVVHDDGSMTLSGGTYSYLDHAAKEMQMLRLAAAPRPVALVTERVRDAVGVFVSKYVELFHETPEDPAASALDAGLRANTTASLLPQVIAGARLDMGFPGILDLTDNDAHPVLQGAVDTLCERFGPAAGLAPDALQTRLQFTPPDERWGVVANALIQHRIGDRVRPEEAARLAPLLIRDLRSTFLACATESAKQVQDTRGRGEQLVDMAVQQLGERIDRFVGDAPGTSAQALREQPAMDPANAYPQVAGIVASVQRRLSVAPSRFWNGRLEATNDGNPALGQAQPDRSLAFDAQRVLAPLAEAHTARRPLDPQLQADVRQAVVVVTREAARLCTLTAPEQQPSDPTAQALEDGLAELYAEQQANQIMVELGHGDPGRPTPNLSAAGRAAHSLTQAVAGQSGLRQEDVVAQLLTTVRNERFTRAVTLGMGLGNAPLHDAERQHIEAHVAPEVRAAFERGAVPDAIAGAKQHYGKLLLRPGADSDLRQSHAAAMTGQRPAGSQAGTSSSSSQDRADPRAAWMQRDGRDGSARDA